MNEEKMQVEKLPSGWLDWNTLTLDQMVNHLKQEFMYQSSGTALCVNKLIKFYEKNNKNTNNNKLE